MIAPKRAPEKGHHEECNYCARRGRDRGWRRRLRRAVPVNGCGVAAGVVGGLAAGAIVGSAIANSCRVRRGSCAPSTSRDRFYAAPPPPVYGPDGHAATAAGMGDGYAYRTKTRPRLRLMRHHRRMCSSMVARWANNSTSSSPFFF